MVIAMALLVASFTVAPATLFAGGHTWTIGEVFSNADGTVQFVRVFECCGGPNELNVTGKRVTSLATGAEFMFTANVAAPTSNKSILLGTAAFAALPGAPTPDHIIPPNFVGLSGDTISLVGTSSSMTWAAGGLPLDGINSLTNPGPTVGTNTPENYAGESGTVDASVAGSGDFLRGDINQDGTNNIADPVRGLDAQFGGNPTSCSLAEDTNDDGQVNIADPIYQLASLFSGGPNPPAPFGTCGADPTPDSLTCTSHTLCP